jgi:hypothetical protein
MPFWNICAEPGRDREKLWRAKQGDPAVGVSGGRAGRRSESAPGRSVRLDHGRTDAIRNVRSVRTEAFIKDWQARIKVPAGIETLSSCRRKQGPPGGDLVVRLAGQDAHTLKLAALDLQASLRQITGVYGIEDDMPYGREQLVFNLTPAGEAMGLTLDDLSRQLRAGLDGKLVQLFQDGADEVEVRVRLPASERASLNLLDRMTVRTPNPAIGCRWPRSPAGHSPGLRGAAPRRKPAGDRSQCFGRQRAGQQQRNPRRPDCQHHAGAGGQVRRAAGRSKAARRTSAKPWRT